MTYPASVAYCCMMSSKPETLHKTTVSAGCFFCSTEVDNAKYRTKIWAQRKANDLAQKVFSIIQVPANNIPDRYLCQKCLRKVEKISRLKEELESCQTHLLEMYNVAVSRSKRCLPTDVVIRGKQLAPYKRAADQSTINSSRTDSILRMFTHYALLQQDWIVFQILHNSPWKYYPNIWKYSRRSSAGNNNLPSSG